MAKNKYEVLVDFLIDITMDKGKVNELAKAMQTELSKINPEMDIDDEKIKKAVMQIANSFDDVDKAIQEIEKHVDEIDFDVADKSLDEFEQQLKGLGNLDLDVLEKALGDMPEEEFKKLKDSLEDVFDSEELSKLGKEIEKTTEEIEQMVLAEKKNLAAMKASGLEGTDAYRKLEKEINDAEQELEGFRKTSEGVKGTFKGFSEGVKESFTGAFAGFGAFRLLETGLENVKEFFNESIEAAQRFESGLAEVSAITGVSGSALDEMGESARQLALRFGGEATDQLNSFKGILSKLGPQIAEQPAALDSMTNSINILAKAGGIDATSSMEALANTLLQFGIDLSNPVTAAKEMERAMNVMAAGAKFGASEIPQISEAVIAAGVAASGANQSIEDVNAQIQILATGGKFGSEAGNALRNVYGLMIKGSGEAKTAFKQLGTTQDEVAAALTNPEKGMAGALQLMQDGFDKIQEPQKRAAILSTIFGVENAAAAGIMLKNIDALKQMKTNITGTNTAYEQAAIIQDTFASRMEVAKAKLSDLGATVGKIVLPVIGFFADHMELAIPIVTALVLGIGALVAPLVAAAAATVALNLAFLASPIGVVALALVGLTTAYMAFHKSSVEVAEDYENEANAALKLAENNIQLNKTKQSLAKSNIDLAKEYFALGNNTKRTAEEEKKFIELHKQLTKAYPGVLGPAEEFRENQEALTKTMGLGNLETQKATSENAKLISRYEELGNKTNRTTAENKEFKKIQGELNKIFPDVIGNTKDWASELNLLKEKAGLTSGELILLQNEMNNLNKEMRQATDNKFVAQMNTATAKARDLSKELNSLGSRIITKGMGGNLGDALGKEFQKLVNKVYGTYDVEQLDKIGQQFFTLLYGKDSGFGKAIAEEGIGEELENFYTQVIELQKQRAAAAGKIKIEPPKIDDIVTPPPDDGTGGAGDKEKVKTAKTLYEIAKAKYDVDIKNLATEKETADVNLDNLFATQGRTKTLWDEYDAHLRNLDVLAKEKEELEALSKVELTPEEIEKGIAEDLINQLQQLANKITAEETKGLEIKGKIDLDEAEFAKQLKDFGRQELEFKIKMGLADPGELLNEMEKDLADIQFKLAQAQLGNDEKLALELKKQVLGQQEEINTKKEELIQQSLERIDKLYESLLEQTKEDNDKELAELQKFNQIVYSGTDNLASEKVKKELDSIDSAEEAKLKKYEEWKELGIVSERQYEKAKTDITNEFNNQRDEIQRQAEDQKMVRSEMVKASEEAFERAKNVEEMAIEDEKLQKKIELLEKSTIPLTSSQQNELLALKEQSQKIKDKMAKDGDELQILGDRLGTGVQESLTAMLSGDPDAMKKAAKKTMAIIAAELKNMASAAIIKLLLSPGVTGTFSFLPPMLIPAAYATASALIRGIVGKLVDPVLSKLTSFAGGGRFDVPTAVVGDAKLAGSPVNTEWVFRDADVMAIAMVAASSGNNNVVNEIRALRNELNAQQLFVEMPLDTLRIGLRRAEYMASQTRR